MRRISSADAGTSGRRERGAELVDASGDDRDLLVRRFGQRKDDGVEAPPQRGRQIVHAAVAVVGGRDQVEAARSEHLRRQLGYRHRLLRQHGDERVLHVGRHAGELLDAHQRTGLHRPVDRARHECRLGRALGDQAGVVPSVAQRLFGRAGRPLHQQRRIAADRCRQVLADPRLGRARDAEQQQGAIGGQGGDGDLDQSPPADVLGRDDRAVAQLPAHQVGDHGPRREPPAGWAFAGVEPRQCLELACVLDLGMRPQHVALRIGCHRARPYPGGVA